MKTHIRTMLNCLIEHDEVGAIAAFHAYLAQKMQGFTGEPVEQITEDHISAEQNLHAVETVLKFDGDIPLHDDGTEEGKKSHNQADKLAHEDGLELYYVTIDPPHAQMEAYVVCDAHGKVSYYDFTHTQRTIVVDSEIKQDHAYPEQEDAIEKVVMDYRFEGGPSQIKPGAIKAYMAALTTNP